MLGATHPLASDKFPWSIRRVGRHLRRDIVLATAYMALLLTLLAWPSIVSGKPFHAGANILHQDLLYRALLPPERWGISPVRVWDPAAHLLHLPADVLAADYFRHGRLPLWNPYNGLGEPLLGNGELAPLSPLKLPLYLLPTMAVYSYYLLLLLGIAGLATFAFGRLIGLSRIAALLSASGFSLSTWVLLHLHNNECAPLALIPLVLWALEHAIRRPNLGTGSVAGLVVGVVALAGHPEGSLWAGVSGAIYAVIRLLLIAGKVAHAQDHFAAVRVTATRGSMLLLAVLIFAGIAMLYILPMLDHLVQADAQGKAAEKITAFVEPPTMLWRLVIPSVFLYLVSPGASVTNLAESNVYTGPLTTVLLVLGLTRLRQHPADVALVGLVAGGLVLPKVYNIPPMILGLAVLSGRGLDALRVIACTHPKPWAGWSLPLGAWLGVLLPTIGLAWATTGANKAASHLHWVAQVAMLLLLGAGMIPGITALVRRWSRSAQRGRRTETIIVGVGICMLLLAATIWAGREIKVAWAGFVAEGTFVPQDGMPTRAWVARAWRSHAVREAHMRIRPEPFQRFLDLGQQPNVIIEPDNSELIVEPDVRAWSAGDRLELALPTGKVTAQLRSAFALLMPGHVALGALGLTVGGLLLAALLWRWPHVMALALMLYSTLTLLRGPVLQPNKSFAFETTPALRWLQEHADTNRVLSWPEPQAALAPNTNAPQRIYSGSLLSFFQSCRYRQVLGLANGQWPYSCEQHIRTVAERPGSHWSNLLGFRYVVTPADVEGRPTADAVERYRDDTVRIYEITAALPRAWLASNVRLVALEQAEEILYTLNTEAVNPRRTALVEESPHAKRIAGELAAAGGRTHQPGTAEVVHASLDSVEIRTASPVPTLLITSDEFNPGWVVSIDDKPATPLRADYLLRAVLVPAGEHLVRWEYRPGYLQPMLLLSGSALALAAVGLMISSIVVCTTRVTWLKKQPAWQGFWQTAPRVSVLLVGWTLWVSLIIILIGFTRAAWIF